MVSHSRNHQSVYPLATGAQRLSASDMVSQAPPAGSYAPLPSAQRLSASDMVSHKPGEVETVEVAVLNAFRHPIWSHRTSRKPKAKTRLCSTPFGIRYGLTPPLRRRVCHSPWVLNAFRHPIWSHGAPVEADLHEVFRAQRLSASDMVSPSASAPPPTAVTVLNAFRHPIWSHGRTFTSSPGRCCMCSTPFGIRYGLTGSP